MLNETRLRIQQGIIHLTPSDKENQISTFFASAKRVWKHGSSPKDELKTYRQMIRRKLGNLGAKSYEYPGRFFMNSSLPWLMNLPNVGYMEQRG